MRGDDSSGVVIYGHLWSRVVMFGQALSIMVKDCQDGGICGLLMVRIAIYCQEWSFIVKSGHW